jgi:hypothetical protein
MRIKLNNLGVWVLIIFIMQTITVLGIYFIDIPTTIVTLFFWTGFIVTFFLLLTVILLTKK